MGVFSRLEGGLDSAFDKAAGTVFRAPIEPAQIAKRAEKQMNREKLVGAGKQYAPTLYTVLINAGDNRKLFGFYPTMAAEIETYLVGKGTENGLKFDGRPLVRFIVDDMLKSGKFDVIAENVAAPIIAQLREEELEYYGLKEPSAQADNAGGAGSEDDAGSGRSSRARRGAGAGAGAVGGGLAAGAGAVAGAGIDEAGIGGASVILPSLPIVAPDEDFEAGLPQRGHASSPDDAGQRPVARGQARITNLNAGKSYALTDAIMVLGRDNSSDIVVDDANVSRRHAQFTQDALGSWKITDLGSTNGTLLNGSPITTALLRDGDQITFGMTILEFRAQ